MREPKLGMAVGKKGIGKTYQTKIIIDQIKVAYLKPASSHYEQVNGKNRQRTAKAIFKIVFPIIDM